MIIRRYRQMASGLCEAPDLRTGLFPPVRPREVLAGAVEGA